MHSLLKYRPGAKQAGLQLLESVTAIPYRGLVIETNNNAARQFSEYCFGYGPTPYPFPFPDWKLGLPDQWNAAGEEDEAAEYKHDFYARHQAPKDNIPQTDAIAFIEEKQNYETNFRPLPFLFSKQPFRLQNPGTNGM
jgi:hypothetical protein